MQEKPRRPRMTGRRYEDSLRPHLPDLDSRVPLGFLATYSSSDFERIARGFKSSSMDEKWDIYYRATWLTFHRSWTGLGILGVRFEIAAEHATVAESWLNGDVHNSDAEGLAFHRKFVAFLIDAFLLRKPAEIPVHASDADLKGLEALAYIHTLVGYLPDMTERHDE